MKLNHSMWSKWNYKIILKVQITPASSYNIICYNKNNRMALKSYNIAQSIQQKIYLQTTLWIFFLFFSFVRKLENASLIETVIRYI